MRDLESASELCRSENARSLFAEALACYRVGAFRASIVAAWTAFVYDYLDKLQELATGGDISASSLLAQFETARQCHDVRNLLRLEQEALDDALKFELITPLEKIDLLRLREDRHRCAHPSLLQLVEPYRPSPELVRAHLRNVLEHALIRPPVQGAKATEAVLNSIGYRTFPTDPEAAERMLASALGHPRDTLIKNLVVLLFKNLLLDDSESPDLRLRRLAALQALCRLHPHVFRDTTTARLGHLVARTNDLQWPRALEVVSLLPDGWAALGQAERERAHRSLNLCEPTAAQAALLEYGLRIADLRTVAARKCSTFPAHLLGPLIEMKPRHEYFERICHTLENEKPNFKELADLRPTLALAASKMPLELLKRLIATWATRAPTAYWGWDSVAIEIIDAAGDMTRAAQESMAQLAIAARARQSTSSVLLARLAEFESVCTA